WWSVQLLVSRSCVGGASELLSRAAASRVDAARGTLDRTGHPEGGPMCVLCAWCLKENKPETEALIGEREPVEDQGNSHGICPHHRQELENRVTQLREELRRHKEMAGRQLAVAEEQHAAAEDLRKNVDP